jgi:hypothetical protein
MKEESRAHQDLCIQTALDTVPPRDLARLREQLTPLARCVFTAEDRHEYTRIVQEWGMRGLPDFAPPMLWGKLYDEYRDERQPQAAALRRHYERLYAPWFEPEARAPNPGLQIVKRTQPGPATSFIQGVSDALESAMTPKDPVHRFFYQLVQKLRS